MKVYLVSCFYHNEGSTNLAIYDSREKAEIFGKLRYENYVSEVVGVSCSMKIQEFEVA